MFAFLRRWKNRQPQPITVPAHPAPSFYLTASEDGTTRHLVLNVDDIDEVVFFAYLDHYASKADEIVELLGWDNIDNEWSGEYLPETRTGVLSGTVVETGSAECSECECADDEDDDE